MLYVIMLMNSITYGYYSKCGNRLGDLTKLSESVLYPKYKIAGIRNSKWQSCENQNGWIVGGWRKGRNSKCKSWAKK